MSKLWKILIGIVATIVVVLVGLAVAVALIFEPNDYRPVIVDTVERSTGRQLELEGDLDLTLFPCCAVAVGPATLSNPKGFPDEAFAQLDGAALSLKIWPLIVRREVQIGTVALNHLRLNLLELSDGSNNWTFDSTVEEPVGTAAPAEDTFSLEGLSIAGLEITDSAISYRNLADQTAYSVSRLHVRTGAIGADLSFRVDASASLAEAAGAAAVDVDLSASLELSGEQVRITDATVTLEGAGSLEPAGARLVLQGSGSVGPSDLSLSGTFDVPELAPDELLRALDVDFRPGDSSALSRFAGAGNWQIHDQKATLSDLNFSLDDTRVTGRVASDDLASADLNLDLQVDAVDIDRYLPANSEQPATPPSAEPTAIPMDTLRDQSFDGQVVLGRVQVAGLNLNDVKLSLANRDNQLSLAATGRVERGSFGINGGGNLAAKEPALSGSVEISSLSPRAILEALGEAPETADPSVLSALSGSALWQLSSRKLALQKIQLKLDQTQATGNLLISDFDRLTTNVELSLDRLDLDAYLPPESATSTTEESDAEIPVALIRDLNLTGKLNADTLKLMKLNLQRVRAEVRAEDGILRLDPLRADLYGGQYTAAVTVDARGARAELALDQQISAVQIGHLLQDYVDMDQVSGALSMKLSGSGSGNTLQDLLQGLDGAFSMRLEDGVYHGMDVQYEIRRARALLKKEVPPAAPAEKHTPIRQLSLSGAVAEGVLGSDDLSALLPGLRLSGKGGVNLVSQVLDYDLIAEVLKENQPSGSGDLTDLVDVAIPLTIEGPVSAPRVGVDLKGLLTRTAQDTLEKRARDLLMKKLGTTPKAEGTDSSTQSEAQAPEAAPAKPSAAEPEKAKSAEETSPRDLLKRSLRDLLKVPDDNGNGN